MYFVKSLFAVAGLLVAIFVLGLIVQQGIDKAKTMGVEESPAVLAIEDDQALPGEPGRYQIRSTADINELPERHRIIARAFLNRFPKNESYPSAEDYRGSVLIRSGEVSVKIRKPIGDRYKPILVRSGPIAENPPEQIAQAIADFAS